MQVDATVGDVRVVVSDKQLDLGARLVAVLTEDVAAAGTPPSPPALPAPVSVGRDYAQPAAGPVLMAAASSPPSSPSPPVHVQPDLAIPPSSPISLAHSSSSSPTSALWSSSDVSSDALASSEAASSPDTVVGSDEPVSALLRRAAAHQRTHDAHVAHLAERAAAVAAVTAAPSPAEDEGSAVRTVCDARLQVGCVRMMLAAEGLALHHPSGKRGGHLRASHRHSQLGAPIVPCTPSAYVDGRPRRWP
jgi:hypothetical protein